MKVQIYTAQSPDEAAALVQAGVDHIGVTPSYVGLPGEVDYQTARDILAAVAPPAMKVALTVSDNLDEIEDMVRIVQPDILHLCGDHTLPPNRLYVLRDRLPGVALMQAISVTGPEAVTAAMVYQHVVDYFILDTKVAHIGGIGASGLTHDWNISREIVEAVRIPVILAGGLAPENVEEAINAVRPWGVDSLTHTNAVRPDGTFCKDIKRVKQFVEAARRAAPVL